MKSRFILFRRAGVYYCEDTTTRKQSSLKTKDKGEALILLNARNESFRQARLNVQIARAYLTASDPVMGARTWQAVTDQMQTHGKPTTQASCARAMQSKAFNALRCKGLMETNAEDYVRNDNHRAKLVKLLATCGPLDIDDPQTAITVMMTDED